jgi:hypothetical protein
MKTITPENYCVILRFSDNEPVFCRFFLLTMDSAIFAKSEGTRNFCDDFLLTSVSDKCACSPPHFVIQEESNPNNSKSVHHVYKRSLSDLKDLKTRKITGKKTNILKQVFILQF